jgi:hypothetical protein
LILPLDDVIMAGFGKGGQPVLAGFQVAPDENIRYIPLMSQTTRKKATREGYEVVSRPPSTLSDKATRQLQRTQVSPKLMSIMEKAHSAQVTRVSGTADKSARKDASVSCPSTKRK